MVSGWLNEIEGRVLVVATFALAEAEFSAAARACSSVPAAGTVLVFTAGGRVISVPRFTLGSCQGHRHRCRAGGSHRSGVNPRRILPRANFPCRTRLIQSCGGGEVRVRDRCLGLRIQRRHRRPLRRDVGESTCAIPVEINIRHVPRMTNQPEVVAAIAEMSPAIAVPDIGNRAEVVPVRADVVSQVAVITDVITVSVVRIREVIVIVVVINAFIGSRRQRGPSDFVSVLTPSSPTPAPTCSRAPRPSRSHQYLSTGHSDRWPIQKARRNSSASPWFVSTQCP